MKERIKRLCDAIVAGERFVTPTAVEYDRLDTFLSPVLMSAKRSKEFILAQTPIVTEDTALTGFLCLWGDVVGDIFNRSGHTNFWGAHKLFYNLPIEGLCTFEWQHSVADFEKVIRIGISGYRAEIEKAKAAWAEDAEAMEFLTALDMIADAISGWAKKCSAAARAKADEAKDTEAKKMLLKLSDALQRVPENPASSFYEAILTVYVIYAFVPDSIGTIDRYLYPFYVKDKANGTLTDEDATAYLQELFLMLQARINPKSDRFYRGGESHFCIGGYLENGEDGFTELSRLVLDSMLELPTWIPQISLRWTKKTPTEVLKYCMDCERRDPNKRIAFVNDEPRIKAFCEIAHFPYELACKYTMVGCNEPQLPGGTFMGGCDANIARSIESTIYNRRDDLISAKSFDEAYKVFEEELFRTVDRIIYWYNSFQKIRSRDTNLVSTMFFEGSIERAKSITQGGAKNAIANLNIMGITTVVDSLAIIKQFVFDEARVSMQTLIDALSANWAGFESLRSEIMKNGKFFGNDADTSNDCAKRFAKSISGHLKDKKSDLGYRYLTGNLIGYNQHNTWFGKATKATPDGRYAGEPISFGIGQTDGRDREGLTAYLSSVAKMNANPILCGSTVTNVLLEESLIKVDANFEKLVMLMETYFKMGGLHFQFTYVSKEDMKRAKVEPEKYKSLRVRVSGFSDYFNNLNSDLQDDMIKRTEKVN